MKKLIVGALAGLSALIGRTEATEDVWVDTNLLERYDSNVSRFAGPTVDNGNNAYATDPHWASGNAYTFFWDNLNKQGQLTYPNDDGALDRTLYFTNEVPRLQSVRWWSNERSYGFGTLVGDIWHRFRFGTYSTFSITMRNALDFEGVMWLDGVSRGSDCAVKMMGDGDKTTGFHQLRTQDYLMLRPMKDGQDILMRHIYGQGLWAIEPQVATSTLTIGDSQSGNAADLNIENSSSCHTAVTLNGPTYETPTLVGTPAFHLDASVASSLSVSGGQVTEWRDLAGSGLAAHPLTGSQYGQTLGYPTLKTDEASGLPVVDLGAYVGAHGSVTPAWDTARYGVPAVLQIDGGLANVREIFVVVRDKHRYNTAAQFIGSDGAFPAQFERGFTSFGSGAETFTLPTLFADFSATKFHRAMEVADVRYDGQRVDQTAFESFCGRLHTLSVGVPEDIRLDFFGHDGVTSRCGGVQIAEVVVYTRTLTSAERREVNAYLKKKWIVGEAAEDRDFGKVRIALENTVKVGSGRVSVRELQLDGDKDTIVKTGGGTFAFAKTAKNELAKVDVQEGGIRFTRDFAETTDDTKPAADPIIWFDASKIDSIVWHDESKGEVEEWNDCRDGTNYMGVTVSAKYVTGEHANGTYTYKADQTLPDGTEVKAGAKPVGNGIGAYPTYVADDNGYPGVHFGKPLRPGNDGWGTNLSGSVLNSSAADTDAWETASYLKIFLGGQKNFGRCVREAFVVAKPTESKVCIKWFGGNTRDVYPQAMGDGNYVSPQADTAFGAYFTRNGVAQKSGMSVSGNANGVRACAGVRFTLGTALNAIAYCGDGGQAAGSGLFSEIVYYDRVLTEAERRQTEAYLMKKWGLGAHPYANRGTAKVAELAFAEDVPAVVDSDRALTIGSVKGGDATLVKKGVGAVEVQSAISQPNVTVAEGALTATLPYEGPYTNALVHFDASDLSTMDWSEETLASGETVTNVTAWYDTRSRTDYNKLLSRVFDPSVKVGYTTYFGAGRLPRIKSMETRTGSGRYIPVMDYGEIYKRTSGSYNPSQDPVDQIKPAGAGAGNDAAMMEYGMGTGTGGTTLTTIREVFIIVKDNLPTNGSPWKSYSRGESIVGGLFSHNDEPFRRGSQGSLIGSDGQSWPAHAGNDAVLNGLASLDDGEAGDPTKIVLPDDGFHLVWFQPTNQVASGGLAFSRMQERGGIAVAELAIFDHVLTDEKRAEIKTSLMNKWFTGDELGAINVGALTVAKDAELNLTAPPDVFVRPTSIANAGTFRLSGGLLVAPTDGFNFVFAAPATCPLIEFDTAFDLTDGGRLTVDFANLKVQPGSYELLRASSLTGTLDGWTVELKNLRRGRSATLRTTATSIFVDVPQPGMLLIVR